MGKSHLRTHSPPRTVNARGVLTAPRLQPTAIIRGKEKPLLRSITSHVLCRALLAFPVSTAMTFREQFYLRRLRDSSGSTH